MPPNIDIENPDQLMAYLEQNAYLAPDQRPLIKVLPGGVSNRTVLVEHNGKAWVLKQALAKLRVAVDWYADPERIHREALGLYWLEQLLPPGSVPRLIFEDRDEHILAMQAVPQPHTNWKSMLLHGEIHEEHVAQFGRMLGTIHRESHLRKGEVAQAFDDRSFFESLRLEPYYRYAAQQVPEAADFLEELIADTYATRQALVHGDFSPKNVLVHRGRLVLLDHEVIHFGDPAFDLGFSLTHFLSKAHHLLDNRDQFASATLDYWNTYIQNVSDVPWVISLERRAVRHTMGCLLARVAGRSPLEYLDTDERAYQRSAVLRLTRNPPQSMPELVDSFLKAILNES
jgi:aminoglycoside phosphotransferase (APT) family kinase protein